MMSIFGHDPKDYCDYCRKEVSRLQLVRFQDFKVHIACQAGMLARLRSVHPEVNDDEIPPPFTSF